MNKNFVSACLVAALFPSIAFAADQVVTPEDCQEFHVFECPIGTTWIRTQSPAGSPSDFDLDFNNDGQPDFSRVVAVGWRTTGGAGDDSLGYHGPKKGTRGVTVGSTTHYFGWHDTKISASSGSATSDFLNLAVKRTDLIRSARLPTGQNMARADTIFCVVATNGPIDLIVCGN